MSDAASFSACVNPLTGLVKDVRAQASQFTLSSRVVLTPALVTSINPGGGSILFIPGVPNTIAFVTGGLVHYQFGGTQWTAATGSSSLVWAHTPNFPSTFEASIDVSYVVQGVTDGLRFVDSDASYWIGDLSTVPPIQPPPFSFESFVGTDIRVFLSDVVTPSGDGLLIVETFYVRHFIG